MVIAIVLVFAVVVIGVAHLVIRGMLVSAAEMKRTATVRTLLKIDPFAVNAANEYGDSLLTLAIERGNVEMVQVLIDHGADLHHDSLRSGMPLQLAVFGRSTEMVEMLLDAGADVNGRSESRPAHFFGTALHMAAGIGNPEITKLLIERGADVNSNPPLDGRTPLHYAAGSAKASDDLLETIRILIDHGADVNARDKLGKTPLDYAGDPEMLKVYPATEKIADLLRQHGARFSAELDQDAPSGRGQPE